MVADTLTKTTLEAAVASSSPPVTMFYPATTSEQEKSTAAQQAALQQRIKQSVRSLSLPPLRSVDAQMREYREQMILQAREAQIQMEEIKRRSKSTSKSLGSVPPTAMLKIPVIPTRKLHVQPPQPKFQKLELGKTPPKPYDAVNPVLESNVFLQPPQNLLRGDNLNRGYASVGVPSPSGKGGPLAKNKVTTSTSPATSKTTTSAGGFLLGRNSTLLPRSSSLGAVGLRTRVQAGEAPLLRDVDMRVLQTQFPHFKPAVGEQLQNKLQTPSVLACVAGPVSPKSDRGRFSPVAAKDRSPSMGGYKLLGAGADVPSRSGSRRNSMNMKQTYSSHLLRTEPPAGMSAEVYAAIVEVMKVNPARPPTPLEPNHACAIVCRELLARLESVVRQQANNVERTKKMVRGFVANGVFSLLSAQQEDSIADIRKVLAIVFPDAPTRKQEDLIARVRLLATTACPKDALAKMAQDLAKLIDDESFSMANAAEDSLVQGVSAGLVRATQKLLYAAVAKNEESALEAVRKELVQKMTALEALGRSLQSQLEQDTEEADDTPGRLKSSKPVADWGVEEVLQWLVRLQELPERDLVFQVFQDKQIFGEQLLTLDEQKLDSMGITTFGTRRHLSLAIRDLKADMDQSGSNSMSNTSSARLATPSLKSEFSSRMGGGVAGAVPPGGAAANNMILKVGMHTAPNYTSSSATSANGIRKVEESLGFAPSSSPSLSTVNGRMNNNAGARSRSPVVAGGATTGSTSNKKPVLPAAKIQGLAPLAQVTSPPASPKQGGGSGRNSPVGPQSPVSLVPAIFDSAVPELRNMSPRSSSPLAKERLLDFKQPVLKAKVESPSLNPIAPINTSKQTKEQGSSSGQRFPRLALPQMDWNRVASPDAALSQLRTDMMEKRARSLERMRATIANAGSNFEAAQKQLAGHNATSAASPRTATIAETRSAAVASASQFFKSGAVLRENVVQPIASPVSSPRLKAALTGVPPLGSGDMVGFVTSVPEGEYLPPKWIGKTGWISGLMRNGKVQVSVHGDQPGTRETAEITTTLLVPVTRSGAASPGAVSSPVGSKGTTAVGAGTGVMMNKGSAVGGVVPAGLTRPVSARPGAKSKPAAVRGGVAGAPPAVTSTRPGTAGSRSSSRGAPSPVRGRVPSPVARRGPSSPSPVAKAKTPTPSTSVSSRPNIKQAMGKMPSTAPGTALRQAIVGSASSNSKASATTFAARRAQVKKASAKTAAKSKTPSYAPPSRGNTVGAPSSTTTLSTKNAAPSATTKMPEPTRTITALGTAPKNASKGEQTAVSAGSSKVSNTGLLKTGSILLPSSLVGTTTGAASSRGATTGTAGAGAPPASKNVVSSAAAVPSMVKTPTLTSTNVQLSSPPKPVLTTGKIGGAKFLGNAVPTLFYGEEEVEEHVLVQDLHDEKVFVDDEPETTNYTNATAVAVEVEQEEKKLRDTQTILVPAVSFVEQGEPALSAVVRTIRATGTPDKSSSLLQPAGVKEVLSSLERGARA
ncbi:unnamed protein product [Amoebophrya sp. A120]|nr:unnamed protein product [Amoebophrya sp. A120]|eukprot:GSA120T00008288001.1